MSDEYMDRLLCVASCLAICGYEPQVALLGGAARFLRPLAVAARQVRRQGTGHFLGSSSRVYCLEAPAGRYAYGRGGCLLRCRVVGAPTVRAAHATPTWLPSASIPVFTSSSEPSAGVADADGTGPAAGVSPPGAA